MMRKLDTAIPDVALLEPKVYGDDRGFFYESYNKNKISELLGFSPIFVQDNHSKSSKGVLRGLHYQINQPQGKLVRVVSGAVLDIVVDIRRKSPTFGQWVGEVLSAENKRMLWIPEGFAHGFYSLTDSVEFLYKATDYYAPQHERCIIWNDKDLKIDWGAIEQPIISNKDMSGTPFLSADLFD